MGVTTFVVGGWARTRTNPLIIVTVNRLAESGFIDADDRYCDPLIWEPVPGAADLTELVDVKIPRKWVELWAQDEPWDERDARRQNSELTTYRQAEDVVIRACRDALAKSKTGPTCPDCHYPSDEHWTRRMTEKEMERWKDNPNVCTLTRGEVEAKITWATTPRQSKCSSCGRVQPSDPTSSYFIAIPDAPFDFDWDGCVQGSGT